MFKAIFYQEKYEREWDEFVLGNESVNGSFLQSRNFLNYHPEDRFVDKSIIIFNEKDKIIAVCPACEVIQGNRKVFFSHKGSTFGGLLISKAYYTTDNVLEIINVLEEVIEQEGFNKIVFKLTSDLFSVENTDLLQYLLTYKGYDEYKELSTYVQLSEIKSDIISSLRNDKRRSIKKCVKNELEFRSLNTEDEIIDFHKILTINLTKFNAKPIHTPDEMLDFYRERLNGIVQFYGVFYKGEQVAGAMMFYFEKTNTLHAQNLSANLAYTDFSPSTFLYYSILKQAKELGYEKVSWGISTEDQGKDINFGLIRNKESYNSRYMLNRTFFKEFMR